MNWLPRLLSLLFIFVVSRCQAFGSQRIVGGDDGQIQHAPYQVSVRFRARASAPYIQLCAGTIHNPHVILTTAMCVRERKREQLLIVAGDTHRTGSKGSVYRVKSIIIPDQFDEWFMDNDVALLLLEQQLQLNGLNMASIPLAGIEPGSGSSATIAGWGATEQLQPAETLQLAQVQLMNVLECRDSYGTDRITEAMLCAGRHKGDQMIDACRGDAGGALVVNGTAVGLVSWGRGCGRPDYPGVYTNLVYLKSWIESQVEKLI